ncbi:MAG: hypothetical protein NVS1B3_04450 [Candidatus Dormibacteraceae bacterium]
MAGVRLIKAAALVGMVAAAIWVIALVIEYQYGLRTPGNSSILYKADQAAFYLAQVGYLVMIIGLFLSRAGGDGWFGRIAIGIWIIAITAIVLGQALGVFGMNAGFLLPGSGVGELWGSILTSAAGWRAGRWTGWRRWAPAAWTAIFFVTIGAAVAAVPFLSIPAVAPYPTAPSPALEALWQAAWFALSLALYIEAGRPARPRLLAE